MSTKLSGFDDKTKLNGEKSKESFENFVENTIAQVVKSKTDFPVSAFPKKLQNVIHSTNECLNFPIDFTGTSILFASSVAIGNSFRVRIKKGFELPCVLYCALVGGKGTMKSHPLTFAIKPLTKRDAQSYESYLLQKSEYDLWIETPKKERDNDVSKPFLKKNIVQDFTPESLQAVHHDNQRGLGAYNDELMAWVNNFGRYSGGSEEQFWLSNWSGTFTDISRKNNCIRINHSFISIAGTIQPKLLKAFAENRMDNGFLDRILFAYPKGLKKQAWNDNELDDSVFEDYNDVIQNLLDLEYNKEPTIIPFETEARKRLFEWQSDNTDIANRSSDYEAGICSKLETYLPRFALILQLLHYACGELDTIKYEISLPILEKAIELIEYFRKTANTVYAEILGEKILEDLEYPEHELYKKLPNEFKRSDAVKFEKELGVSERTIERYLDNKKIYIRVKMGCYKKVNCEK